MKKTSFSKIIFFIFFAVIVVIVLSVSKQNSLQVTTQKDKEVKIGYFIGGRTKLLFRSYSNNEFEKEGTPISLITKDLYHPDFYTLPKSFKKSTDIEMEKTEARATGVELIEGVIKGKFDGATPGESSFIEAIGKNAPIVAVAMLGYDTKEKPGHAIIFRKDIVIKTPQDIKGKILATRRAGPGDLVFLLEYLEQIGLDPDKDITIAENVKDDQFARMLTEGKVDGGYYHLNTLNKIVKEGNAYIYRKLDWVNAELSHALLVFHKDFVKTHPEKVKNIVRTYMKRIKYENTLPQKEDFQGLSFPQYKFPPKAEIELLDEMQDLLLKHQVIDKKADLSDFVDNSFVDKVYEELK